MNDLTRRIYMRAWYTDKPLNVAIPAWMYLRHVCTYDILPEETLDLEERIDSGQFRVRTPNDHE